jgi:hypothetical protein
MKLTRRNKLGAALALLAALSAAGCRADVIIQQADLKDWYVSRLFWSVFLSIVLGAVAAKLLCRLPIKAPLLDCIGAARSRFTAWLLVLVLLVAPLTLWLDAWFRQPFGEGNVLDALGVLSIAILNWRTLALMGLSALAFYLSVAVFTRYVFGGTCNCKYAFIPKLR